MYSFRNHHFRLSGVLPTLFTAIIFPLYGQDKGDCAFESENKVVHYCNLDDPGDGPRGQSLKIGPFPGDKGVAQKFTAGEAGNVCSVTVGLARVGSPEGKMIVSIHEVDESTGYPGQAIGTLGEIEIKSLPKVVWGSLPEVFEGVTIEGEVSGLLSGTEYFLHLVHTEDFIARGGPGGPTDVWFVDLVPTPSDAEHAIVEWADPPSIPAPAWGTDWPNLRLRAHIEGSFEPNEPLTVDIEPAVAIRWESQADKTYEIHSSTDLGNWTVAVEAIEGTGERLTRCFIRQESKIYYRVKESK